MAGRIKEVLDFAKEVLKDSNRPLSATEIWKIGLAKGLNKKLSTEYKYPTHAVSLYLSNNTKKSNSIFDSYSARPVLYWLKEKGKIDTNKLQDTLQTNEDSSENNANEKFKERDLHPLFVKFAKDNFGTYCKTIYHEKSLKGTKGKDRWIHPDIVGVHFAFMNNYEDETIELQKSIENEISLYSFELKISISWDNYKEAYFQAVSNSSWANYGYLVVFDEINDDEMLNELTRLNNSFGIGVICLSNEEILLESKIRNIDFETLDVLVRRNLNFKEFIKAVNKDKKK